MLERVDAMLFKEFRQFRRDRWLLMRLVLPLVVQLLLFGYAASFTVHDVATAVLDLDGSQASRALVSRFVASGRFRLVAAPADQRQLERDIDRGDAVVGIVVPVGFQRALQGQGPAPLQVVVDGTNSNTALIAAGYVGQIVGAYAAEAAAALQRPHAPARAPGLSIELEPRPWFNPGLLDTWFFIPGVIGSLTLLQVVTLTAFAIVREREVGTLEQIMVSPITPLEFIVGKTLPSFVIGSASITLVTLLGALWFGVPFVGSLAVMAVGAALFLLAVIGLGLLLSTFSRTQQQAFALNFFLVNPFFILSGFAFPIAAMPRALQWFTLVNPLRYFLVVIRAVFLKGVGFAVLWPQLLALAGLAAAMLLVSVLRFRASIEA